MPMLPIANLCDIFSSHRSQETSWIDWMGYRICLLKEKLDPIPYIVNALAFCLFPLAARCVVFTSSRSFKKSCKPARLAKSRKILEDLGGEKIQLKMPDGHYVTGIYMDSKKCLDAMLVKGAEKGCISLSDGKIQEVLWIDPAKEELSYLVKEMQLAICEESGKQYLPIGIPTDPSPIPSNISTQAPSSSNGTLIYAPGSGHLFEFRRKTIGSFLIGYGMNVLLFHYSGTGQSEGKITEQATYENLECVYQYLRQKGIRDEQILGYGHCMGGGPMIDLAAKHPINLLADRTPLSMGEFSKLRATTFLRLPRFLHFLASWIPPVMDKCFLYNNGKKIKHVKGNVAVLEARQDEMIPPCYIQELFDNAVSAKNRIKLTMDSNHDMDLVQDEEIRLSIGQFLADCKLIGG